MDNTFKNYVKIQRLTLEDIFGCFTQYILKQEPFLFRFVGFCTINNMGVISGVYLSDIFLSPAAAYYS